MPNIQNVGVALQVIGKGSGAASKQILDELATLKQKVADFGKSMGQDLSSGWVSALKASRDATAAMMGGVSDLTERIKKENNNRIADDKRADDAQAKLMAGAEKRAEVAHQKFVAGLGQIAQELAGRCEEHHALTWN